MQGLQRPETLIMIHGQNRIEGPGISPEKNRVRWQRADDVESLLAGLLHGRLDDAPVFITKQSSVPTMRIESGDGKPRFADTENPLQGALQKARFLNNDFG